MCMLNRTDSYDIHFSDKCARNAIWMESLSFECPRSALPLSSCCGTIGKVQVARHQPLARFEVCHVSFFRGDTPLTSLTRPTTMIRATVRRPHLRPLIHGKSFKKSIFNCIQYRSIATERQAKAQTDSKFQRDEFQNDGMLQESVKRAAVVVFMGGATTFAITVLVGIRVFVALTGCPVFTTNDTIDFHKVCTCRTCRESREGTPDEQI